MIIEPVMRGFICLTAHPKGCAENVGRQIDFVKAEARIDGAKNVLIIGASTGFGLASRITCAFGLKASTIGVFFDKPAQDGKTASPGWYNTAAFHEQAKKAGLYAASINSDAFSHATKQKTIELIKKDLGKIDMVIYSVASPVRLHPESGKLHHTVLKPIGGTFASKTVDFHTGVVSNIAIPPGTETDIADTIAVMGGEDWQIWINALLHSDTLSQNVITVAYSYIGSTLTEPIYRKGTIGKAKDNLEATASRITADLKSIQGTAYISVNKALVTQASSAIPVIPLYISLLYKTMKERGIHEGCIEQIYRLFVERLFTGKPVPTDDKGRIRMDDWEMRTDVQDKVGELWYQANTENLPEIGDLHGYTADFLTLFGFGLPGVDYTEDVDECIEIDGLR